MGRASSTICSDNSLGHRKNILKESYKYLGVGVAFNNESQPYNTENFYSDLPSI
jgi:uncharacterized protein YkwD